MKIILFFVMLLFSSVAYADDSRYYEPGPDLPEDAPSIPNDNAQNGDLNSNQQNSNNNNRTTTNIGAGSGSPTPVNTAIAPSLMSSGSDTCLQSRGTGVQLLDIGVSRGAYKQDEECNRRRDAKVFKDLGMILPAVSRMCQNDDNWKAMFQSGNPCPILVNGRMVFGKRAVLAMRNQPDVYIPDYNDDKKYYDTVLGIGKQADEQTENTGNDLSVSERFRSSRTSSVE